MTNIIRVDELEGGGLFYKGTFKSLSEAVLDAMGDMEEHAKTFKDNNKNEYYVLEPLFMMDGDAAYCIIVHYKSKHWENEVVEKFYFLEGEEEAK